MELPYRKSREDDDREQLLEETNDVRSSLQGPLREGVVRDDPGFLGGGNPASTARRLVYSIYFVLTMAVLSTVC